MNDRLRGASDVSFAEMKREEATTGERACLQVNVFRNVPNPFLEIRVFEGQTLASVELNRDIIDYLLAELHLIRAAQCSRKNQ